MKLIGGLLIFYLGIVKSEVDKQAVKDVSATNNAFSRTLYDKLSQDHGNLFFSPASVHTVLGMLYPGTDGITRTEFQNGLHFGNLTEPQIKEGFKGLIQKLKSQDPQLVLDIANKIFLALHFAVKPEYLEDIKNYFSSEIQKLDFAENQQAANAINSWVEEKTHQKIQNMVDPGSLGSSTSAVLVNAIYFKGLWRTRFDPRQTNDMPFHGEGGTKDVKMMHVVDNFRYADVEALKSQVLELPYNGTPAVSMLIILPKPDVPIKEVENLLKNYNLNSMRLYSTKVHVTMPKFKITQTIDLNQILSDMGFKSMFGNPNFSKMSSDNIRVSKVLQKAFIEVNEEGSEAAAATAVVITDRVDNLNQELEAYFIADRQFLFIIKEDLINNVIFIGRLSE